MLADLVDTSDTQRKAACIVDDRAYAGDSVEYLRELWQHMPYAHYSLFYSLFYKSTLPLPAFAVVGKQISISRHDFNLRFDEEMDGYAVYSKLYRRLAQAVLTYVFGDRSSPISRTIGVCSQSMSVRLRSVVAEQLLGAVCEAADSLIVSSVRERREYA